MARITREHARRLALAGQMLAGQPDLPPGREGAAAVVGRLGYVQIDTIHVIERAHHHTLWTRHRGYDPAMLHELQAVDRRVFEYWGHAASYLPMQDYRYYLPRMKAYENPRSSWVQSQVEACADVIGPVLQRIRDEGPLRSSDFKRKDDAARGTWWDWKPAKMALEILFWRGELMIAERRNFQRVYDLTERVLPADVDTRFPDDGETGRFFVRRALAVHGVATQGEIRRHMPVVGQETVASALRELTATGEVVHVAVGEAGSASEFALAATLQHGEPLAQQCDDVVFLSPFDNLIIERTRTKRLFGFDYTLECYTPAARRMHGYYVLPILWRGALVGRLDPKADRKSRRLRVRSLALEPGFVPSDELPAALGAGLVALARFNGCNDVVFEAVRPAKLKHCLRRLTTAFMDDELE